MAAILIGFFGVVILVNFTMAYFASRTFGGLVVENSYVASQKFNGWLAEARAQQALGWQLDATRAADGRVDLALASADLPMTDARITALARHPLGRLPERTLAFRSEGDGHYRSVAPLPGGRWIVHLDVQAHGRAMRRVIDVQ
jgi:nitrogen fixation protein FixH